MIKLFQYIAILSGTAWLSAAAGEPAALGGDHHMHLRSDKSSDAWAAIFANRAPWME